MSIEIVKERLSQPDCERGFILDGFPRTVPQAIALDRALPKLGKAARRCGQHPDLGGGGRAAHRGAGRLLPMRRHVQPGDPHSCRQRVVPGVRRALVQRPDDTVETAKNRLMVYMDQTHPVVHYYAEQGILVSVDGQRPIDEVFEEHRGAAEEDADAQRPVRKPDDHHQVSRRD